MFVCCTSVHCQHLEALECFIVELFLNSGELQSYVVVVLRRVETLGNHGQVSETVRDLMFPLFIVFFVLRMQVLDRTVHPEHIFLDNLGVLGIEIVVPSFS